VLRIRVLPPAKDRPLIPGAERIRLAEDARRERNWKRWGPYLAERQWGTVREDYSADGRSWDYFPHDHARSRAYRWGEDGLLGICDRECRLCFAVALWNERDPILKERLFGLAGTEGNHGEDVKECYFYLDATPTHSYLKALYRYPQREFPYLKLIEENRRRGRGEPEYELSDTGLFADGRYFDLTVEYAKAGPDDILIRLTAENHGPEAATLHLLPTLWFRNVWSWGRSGEGYGPKPRITRGPESSLMAEHATLGTFRLAPGLGPFGRAPALIFTENETNSARLYGDSNGPPFAKDAFHDYVVRGGSGVVNPTRQGTKAAAYYRVELPARERFTVRLRLFAAAESSHTLLGREFDAIFESRIREADEFYCARLPEGASDEERRVLRQGHAGLLWSKQFYHYVVAEWLEGDPALPPPPASRREGRNAGWPQLYNRDVISMPDKWEYPWYAAWDLAFHMIPFARLDPEFAKEQLLLFMREWYMNADGQLPAYEWALSDVNPPVHAWACWRVYKITGARGQRDRSFLERAFHKLLLNFTWWVNRKDADGNNLFAGGFLGLDNVGVFDRSKPLPTGGHLEQADGTAWMAFYCATMLSMALELASEDPAYEDVASKFFEHFVAITDAMNGMSGGGLWDESDGFYYDQLHVNGTHTLLKVRSGVGIIPLFAVENLEESVVAKLPGFSKRMRWFLENRPEFARHVTSAAIPGEPGRERRLLAIASRDRLERVLARVLDENEFLSPWGVRSLSRAHRDQPFVFEAGGTQYKVDYQPDESRTGEFGGNSNWRGPVWFPLNYLLIEALERHHHFYGDRLKVECPTGSGKLMTLCEVAHELSLRLTSLFMPREDGERPCHGGDALFMDPAWRDLVLFHEYFSGDTGRGLGAAHQTGWTALVTEMIEDIARRRAAAEAMGGGAMATAAEAKA
jgi:hypothetical protein